MLLARELAEADPTLYMPFQYGNAGEPAARTSAARPRRSSRVLPEVDVFVAGLGTGGTLMGCARRLRRDRPDVQVVAAEPLPGEGIDGLRSLEDGYTPEILDLSLLDRKLLVSNEESVRGLRALAREEGLFAGVSSGGVLHAAMRVARDLEGPANIVMVLADGGWKYLSAGLWDTPEDELARAHGAGRLVVDAAARAGRRDDRPRPLGAPERGVRHLRRDARRRAAHVPPRAQRRREPVPLQRRPDDLLRIALEIDEGGDDVAAIYHSHTMSPASPSRTDMELATWPEAAYVIVSLAERPARDPRLAPASRAARPRSSRSRSSELASGSTASPRRSSATAPRVASRRQRSSESQRARAARGSAARRRSRRRRARARAPPCGDDAAHDRRRQLVAVAQPHVGRALAAHDGSAVERSRQRAAVGAHEAADAEVGAAVPAHDDGRDVVQARRPRAPPAAARPRCRPARRRRSRTTSRRAAGRRARRASGCGARAPRAAKNASAPARSSDGLGDREEARAALLELGRDAAGERARTRPARSAHARVLGARERERDDQQGDERDHRDRRPAAQPAPRLSSRRFVELDDRRSRAPRRRSGRRCARPSRSRDRERDREVEQDTARCRSA